MAPLPPTTTSPPLAHATRRAASSSWTSFLTGHEHQPTPTVCLLAVVAVVLLVLASLIHTSCRPVVRHRVYQRRRGDNGQKRAATLEMFQRGKDLELKTRTLAKELEETAAPWHGSNTLNTSWGWMA